MKYLRLCTADVEFPCNAAHINHFVAWLGLACLYSTLSIQVRVGVFLFVQFAFDGEHLEDNSAVNERRYLH